MAAAAASLGEAQEPQTTTRVLQPAVGPQWIRGSRSRTRRAASTSDSRAGRGRLGRLGLRHRRGVRERGVGLALGTAVGIGEAGVGGGTTRTGLPRRRRRARPGGQGRRSDRAISHRDHAQEVDQANKVGDQLQDSSLKEIKESEAKAAAALASYRLVLVTAALLVIVVGFLFGASVTRSIAGPIGDTVRGLTQVAQGNLVLKVSAELLARKDEAGQLSQATQQLATSLHTAIGEMAGGVRSLAEAAKKMQGVARNLTDGNRRVSELATTVAAAAEESSVNATSVAAGMEQTTTNLTSRRAPPNR